MDILHLYYIADELRIRFPIPFTLQMDNTAAKAFAENTVIRSKLKHIDCRQEWVKVVRDKNIMTPKYVPTDDNLADLFTKILSRQVFEKHRNTVLNVFCAAAIEKARLAASSQRDGTGAP